MPPDASSRESARATIAALVEHYVRNRDRYLSSTYNEETCRAEFITPLFGALGWDVTNKAGYAEQYKDVIHEEGIKVGDFTKAPDYTFRVAGVRKFFVEAKKPFVDLKSDPAPAYQLRRYAWSAKLPLSVLTDFEEIAVYDTRKVLKPILQNLYYPQSPYEFSVLPVEILGNVYEQFLGKVIRLTKGHRAVVEEKPEVKKAGGVYYTPAYIVDYIVKQTVGELCEGKSPKQMEKLRILDPACGSGSFLLRAYQELLDRHLAWYREHQPEKHRKEVFPGPGGDWRLTTAEKRRIVLNNIYGVDIDRQAVEVTKLSLLLKVLEGENDETLKQHSLFGERALPSLEGNIKCGNSLVSSDLVGEDLFEDDELSSSFRPFDWSSEFPRVFATGGFDVVIGNPPYSYRNATEDALRPYYDERYASTQGNYDLYKFFLERSIQLVAPKGIVGMIVSASFLVQPSFSRLRELLLNQSIELLAPLGPGAFAKATVDTAVVVLKRVEPSIAEFVSFSGLILLRTSRQRSSGWRPVDRATRATASGGSVLRSWKANT